MLVRKSSLKGPQTRFTLLLLEDGEFFLDDYSAYRYHDPEPNGSRKNQGRLKVCTRSFFFEPSDSNLPILRFPYRDMAKVPNGEFIIAKDGDQSLYLTFECKTVIEMKDRDVDHPYIVREKETKHVFALVHSSLDAVLKDVEPCWQLAHDDSILNKVEEEQMLESVLTSRLTDAFDSSLLVDFRERPLLSKGMVVDRIVPLLKHPGCLMLTNQRLYFQPAQVNNVGDPVLNFPYNAIEYMYKRRHMLKQTGLEIFLRTGEGFFFSFRTSRDRDDLYNRMVSQPDLKRLTQTDLESVLLRWQKREISNFDYLLYLNNTAGRTKNDLTQYPVFPWILQDYDSPTIDLSDPSVYRDLSKPIGALNHDRLEAFKQRFEAMPRGMEAEGIPPPFLYGTHYSTPGYVLYYLVRMAPEYMLCLQNGKFDAADRLFKSIPSTWRSCLTNPADLKELIPAFFDESLRPDEWLKNQKNLNLGTTQNMSRVADVELPPWACSPSDFVRTNREALESDYVSEHLHEWINLIFGYQQRGEEAVKADNLFYYLSYEGSVDLESVTDPVEKCSLEAQIQEFGQTPTLLFTSAHPSRNDIGKAVDIAKPDSYRQRDFSLDATGSESSSMMESDRGTFTSVMEAPTDVVDDCDQTKGNGSWFQRPTFGVPKQAQRLVGGLTATIKRRMSNTPLKKWNWTVGENVTDSDAWLGPSIHYTHAGEVTSMTIARDNRVLFSASKDMTMKVTVLEDGTRSRSLTINAALTCCAVSSDEKVVFIGSSDHCIYMYSMEAGRVIDQVKAHEDEVSALYVVDDRLISGSWDSSVKVWHFTSSGFTKVPVTTFDDCDESVRCVHASYDGLMGASATGNGMVYVFDLRTGEKLMAMTASPMYRAEVVSLTFCGLDRVACATGANEIAVFCVDGTPVLGFEAQMTGTLRCFDTDGETAVGGTSNGHLMFWNLEGAKRKELIYDSESDHKSAVTSVSVSSNGNVFVSANADGSIRVWNLRRKGSQRRLPGLF